MNYYSDHDILNILRKLYPNTKVNLHEVNFSGSIVVFTIFFKTLEDLKQDWSDVYNTIAAYYQSYLSEKDDEFKRWNIYLIYLCRPKVNLALKYKIENDKFSSRKIIIDEFDDELNEETIELLIKEHITNTDLLSSFEDKSTTDKLTKYNSNSVVWKIVKKISPTIKRKRIFDTVEKLLDEIEIALKL